jgi:hypothetical protein
MTIKADKQRSAYSGCVWGDAAVSLATFVALAAFITVLLVRLHAHIPLRSAVLGAGKDALVAFCAIVVLSVSTLFGSILLDNWSRRKRKR